MILETLFFLLQSPPQKVQWWMWTLAVFFFLLGLGLLIYLMTRPKLNEQEEELESRPRKVLSDIESDEAEKQPDFQPSEEFSAPPQAYPEELPAPPELHTPTAIGAESHFDSGTEVLASPVSHTEPIAAMEEPVLHQTASLWNEPAQEESQEVVLTSDSEMAVQEPETQEIPAPEETVELPSKETSLISGQTSVFADGMPTQRQAEVTEVKEMIPDSGTQVLASHPTTDELPVNKTISVESNEVLNESDVSRKHTSELATPMQPPAPPMPASDKSTRPYIPVFNNQLSASVSESNTTDSLRTRPMREPFLPPRIEPIAPKPQPDLLVSSTPPLPDAGTQAFSSTARPTQVYSTEERGTQEFSVPELPYETPEMQPTAQPVYEAAHHTAVSRPAGSVLGLPLEAPHSPLILGQPVKSQDEIGVTSFSNYDKPQDVNEKRWGGVIAVLLAALLLGGGTLAYFRVPKVHGWVDRIRGVEQQKPVEKAKAQIIPAYPPEVNKKMVKSKGAVLNTSDQTLVDLSVEVALYRGNELVESRTVPVTPATLEPGKQGEYVFEYDGSNAGFSRYSITKLMSNGGDVKFTIPKL